MACALNNASLIENDFRAVLEYCSNFEDCPFRDFEIGDHFCVFRFKDGLVEKWYQLHYTDEYPESSLLTVKEQSVGKPLKTVSEQNTERFQIIFSRIANELHLNMEVKVADGRGGDCVVDDEPGDANIEDDNNNRERVLKRAISSDYNSDDSWSDDYDIYNDEMDMELAQTTEIHNILQQDMDNVLELFGEKSLTFRNFGGLDDIDIELHLDLHFLDAEIAKAWKVLREEPITIRLHLCRSNYLDAGEPRVEVFQPSQKKFGVGSQLKKIMETFLSENWKNLSNSKVREMSQAVTPKNPSHRKTYSTQHSTSSMDEKPPLPPPRHSTADDQGLAELINMGFEVDMARNALVISRGSVSEAVNLLVSNPQSCKNPSHSDDSTASAASALTLPPPPPVPAKSKTSKKQAHRQTSLPSTSSGTSDKGFLKTVSKLLSGQNSTPLVKNPKEIPSLKYGFLVQIMQYAQQRLPMLNEFCVICDRKHLFQNGAMLKPAVCSGELCIFSFQTLGVMSEAADDIATAAEVVDLLIAMATAACKSGRRDIIFDPFPTVIDPKKPSELAFCPKKKNYADVEKSLSNFQTVQEMAQLDAAGLKKAMDQKDMLAYPLLQWIINSNRSHIVKLPKRTQLVFMHTEHQYLLMSSPPAKEAAFRQAKSKYGSTFAFHGSTIENWHSIMRQGLLVCSGSKYQLHGAAYGKGIYLSPSASVSFGYSGNRTRAVPGANIAKKPPTTPGSSKLLSDRFLKSKNLTCIALCEVVTSDSLLKKGNEIWVMQEPDHVCTRFFFVTLDVDLLSGFCERFCIRDCDRPGQFLHLLLGQLCYSFKNGSSLVLITWDSSGLNTDVTKTIDKLLQLTKDFTLIIRKRKELCMEQLLYSYENGIIEDSAVETQLDKYKKEIESAMAFSYT